MQYFMDELRRHRRMKIPLKVELRHPATGKIKLDASDMSDGGVFLLLKDSTKLPVGDSVLIRTLGLGINGSETGPPLVMTVARQTKEGVGLKFEETASANLYSWDSENLARQAIRQSLLIANNFEQLLVITSESKWGLPNRQLQGGDTWQLGIETIRSDLEARGALGKEAWVLPESLCIPSALGEPGSIDLLIPCKISNRDLAPDLNIDFQDGVHHRWVDSNELVELLPSLDSKLIDKALGLVRH